MELYLHFWQCVMDVLCFFIAHGMSIAVTCSVRSLKSQTDYSLGFSVNWSRGFSLGQSGGKKSMSMNFQENSK